MINKFFNKSNSKEKISQKTAREIIVRVIRPQEKPKLPSLDLEDIKKEYEMEEKGLFLRSYNILGCGVLGACVGFLFAVLMLYFGAHLSSHEISFMVGIPAFLGAFAGYVIC